MIVDYEFVDKIIAVKAYLAKSSFSSCYFCDFISSFYFTLSFLAFSVSCLILPASHFKSLLFRVLYFFGAGLLISELVLNTPESEVEFGLVSN